MNFDPPLSLKKKLALDDIHYTNSIKIFLNFDFPFWQYPRNAKVKMSIPFNTSEINGGSFLTDLPIRQGFYPTHSYYGSSILASYVWEDDADKMMPYSDEELVALAMDNLETLHGDDVKKHFIGGRENYVIKRWGNDKNTFGAFVYRYPGQLPDLFFTLQVMLFNHNFNELGKIPSTNPPHMRHIVHVVKH